MKVGILGSGDVGKVLAGTFKSEGHEVMIATRDTKSAKAAELVFVAGLVCILVLFVGEYAYFAYFLIPVLMYFSTRNLKVIRKSEGYSPPAR